MQLLAHLLVRSHEILGYVASWQVPSSGILSSMGGGLDNDRRSCGALLKDQTFPFEQNASVLCTIQDRTLMLHRLPAKRLHETMAT
eukprot:6213956-Pleurochrysis_carterae.AAC.1